MVRRCHTRIVCLCPFSTRMSVRRMSGYELHCKRGTDKRPIDEMKGTVIYSRLGHLPRSITVQRPSHFTAYSATGIMSDTGPQLKSVAGRATGKARHHFYFYDMIYIEVRWPRCERSQDLASLWAIG